MSNESKTLPNAVPPGIGGAGENSAGLLLMQVAPLDPDMSCLELHDYFMVSNTQVEVLPVVRDGRALGLVTRYSVVSSFSKLYFREIYSRQPVTAMMNDKPLIVERSLDLDALGALVARDGEALSNGFIIVEDGAYLGLGTGQALLRELTARKEAHLAAARAELLAAQAELLEKQRMRQELSIAREIQNGLLPKSVPSLAGYEVLASYRPAQEIGGDYYDFFDLPDGNLGLVVADVSGKGVPGALGMTLTRMVLRTQALFSRNPAEILARSNSLLMPDLPANMFITVFHAVLDPRANLLRCASAGHNPAFYIGAGGSAPVSPDGMALGLASAERFVAKEVRLLLEPGGLFALYTDGVTEAMNPDGEEYGEERFLASLRSRAADLDPVSAVLDDLAAFVGAAPASDDITLVLLRRRRH